MRTAFKVTATLLVLAAIVVAGIELGDYRLKLAVRKLEETQSKLNKIYMQDKKYPKTCSVTGSDTASCSYISNDGYFKIDCTIRSPFSEDIKLTADPVFIRINIEQDGSSEILKSNFSVLRELASMDPEKEIAKAVANNDFRFVAVYGYSKSVPGIDNYHEKYESTYGEWAVPGTGDVIYGDEHFALNLLANQFATNYNQRLLEVINKKAANKPDKQD